MKKFKYTALAALLVITMALGLTSCGGKDKNGNADTSVMTTAATTTTASTTREKTENTTTRDKGTTEMTTSDRGTSAMTTR